MEWGNFPTQYVRKNMYVLIRYDIRNEVIYIFKSKLLKSVGHFLNGATQKLQLPKLLLESKKLVAMFRLIQF